MCKDREVFNHLEESAVSGVLLADKGITPTEGQGSVTLNLNSPENLTLTLNEVLHVPGLRENLLFAMIIRIYLLNFSLMLVFLKGEALKFIGCH